MKSTENNQDNNSEGLIDGTPLSMVDDPALTTDELEQKVESTLHGFEDNFRKKYPLMWVVTLVIPPILLLGALVAVFVVQGWLYTTKLLGLATATFFFLGRFVILFGQHPEAAGEGFMKYLSILSPRELFWMVTYMDFAATLLVAFHVGALFRLPWLGERVAGLVEDARFILDSIPWMRRLAFTGLTLFVAFPLAATGAVGGAILGTLLGLSRTLVFIATILGCLVGNGILLFAADTIHRIAPDLSNHPVVRFGGIAVIVGLILYMEFRYKKQKKKYHDAHEKPTPS